MTPESLPQISMSRSARYVTQSSLFDNIRLGRLTNAKIAKYQRAGKYSNGFKEERKEIQEKKPGNKRRAARKLMVGLLGDLLK